MITLHNISLGYKGKRLVERANAEFSKGSLTALIGRNGTGKSTLLRAIMGLEKTLQGDILIARKPVMKLTPYERATKIAMVNTRRIRIENLTCQDIVALARSPYTDWMGRLRQEDCDIVHKALAMVEMEDYAMRPINSLSDGEAQRIMIARALAQQTDAILLDEPTSFLDLPSRYVLVSLLGRLAHKQCKCVIFSTHELDIALKYADNIALIDSGELLCLTAGEMRQSNVMERIFRLPETDIPSTVD